MRLERSVEVPSAAALCPVKRHGDLFPVAELRQRVTTRTANGMVAVTNGPC